EQFAENLTQVSAVDLVDDEDIFMVRVICGALTEFIEHAILQAERPCLSRHGTISAHKIVIRIRLMKLHRLAAFRVDFLHQSISELSRKKSFSDAGRALQNEGFLGLQPLKDFF